MILMTLKLPVTIPVFDFFKYAQQQPVVNETSANEKTDHVHSNNPEEKVKHTDHLKRKLRATDNLPVNKPICFLRIGEGFPPCCWDPMLIQKGFGKA